MADLISRLKLESGEFESKIARATKGLLTMEKECREVGGTLAILDKEQLEFVRGLGQMETVTQNAKGKVAELTAAYTELSIQYNRLTKEEKNGDYGRALASSLDQLKRRIKDSKSELAGVEGSLNGVGDAFKQLGNKIGIPMEVFSKFGPILAAVGAAAKVAKDAFFANESMVDEWGRTVESAKSIYEGFVTSLNTGDFGGFLSRMSSISAAARKAYDELDRLGTMKTIQSPEMSRLQAENERNRMMLQTRRYIAPLDGSDGIPGMKNGQLLSDAQVKSIESELKNGIQRIAELVTNEVQQTTNAIEAEYNRQANVIGLNLDEFKKGTSSMAEFDSMLKLAKKYSEFENEHTVAHQSIDNMGMLNTTYIRDNAANPYQQYKGWNVFRVDGDKFKELVTLIQQRDQQMVQAYSMQSQAYRAINRVNGVTARSGGEGQQLTPLQAAQQKITDLANEALTADDERQEAIRGEIKLLQEEIAKYKEIQDYVQGITKQEKSAPQITGPSGYSQEGISALRSEIQGSKKGMQVGSKEYMVEANRLVDLITFENLLKTAVQRGVELDPALLESAFEKIDLGLDVKPEEWQNLVDTINEQVNELNPDPIKLDVQTGAVTTAAKNATDNAKSTADAWQNAVAAVNNVGSALQQIEDPSAKVSGIVMQAVANIALGFAQAAASPATGAAGVFGWIAAATAGLATMVTTIASIKSVTSGGFANGGVIPGNSFSGDNIRGMLPSGEMVGLDAGELILNRAQQSNIAGQLQNNNPLGNLQLTSKVRGSDLLIVLDNTNSSRGGQRGMYVNVR